MGMRLRPMRLDLDISTTHDTADVASAHPDGHGIPYGIATAPLAFGPRTGPGGARPCQFGLELCALGSGSGWSRSHPALACALVCASGLPCAGREFEGPESDLSTATGSGRRTSTVGWVVRVGTGALGARETVCMHLERVEFFKSGCDSEGYYIARCGTVSTCSDPRSTYNMPLKQ